MKTIKFFAAFALAATLASCSGNCCQEPAPKIVNVINFLRQNDYRIADDVALLYEAAEKEVELSRQYGFPTTFLLQYDALVDPAYQKLMKDIPADWEIGGWWEITKPQYEDAGLEWPFEQVWYPYDVKDFGIGHSPEVREKLVDVYMAKFKEIFGYYPKSMGSWYLDAYTLDYMVEKYGIVSSCVCKEQVGTDGYTLWGSYWNQAFYPSKLNAHMPAQTHEGQIDVSVFRMLGSDPIYQYEDGLEGSWQQVFTMEPASGNTGNNPQWIRNFLNTLVDEPCLEFNYVQVGQENSFTWGRIGDALKMQFDVIDSLRTLGKLRIETLAESGEWFSRKYDRTPATAFTMLNDYKNCGKKTVWYESRYYRANLMWEDGAFRFRDIHLFDEKKASPYIDKAANGTKLVYHTLPVMDGFWWSRIEDKAGIYVILENGERAVFSDPKIREEKREHKGEIIDEMTIFCRDQKGGRYTIVLDEDSIEIDGPKSSKWYLQFYAAFADKSPFTRISGDRVSAEFEGFSYSFEVSDGFASVGEGNSLLTVVPNRGEVEFDFDRD